MKPRTAVTDESKMLDYYPSNSLPKQQPADGRVIVHNSIRPVRHTQRHGVNGFRFWRAQLNDRLEKCECGWSGLEHYHLKIFAAHFKGFKLPQ
jgi:hypothetical protein